MVSSRCIGIDIGAETIKLVELVRDGGDRADGSAWRWTRRRIEEHGKEPGAMVLGLLRDWGWDEDEVASAAISGRMSRHVALPRVPTKQALARGYRFLHQDPAATIVSIGSHGFSVLELRDRGTEVFRENSRCSQGTGNFLRQLVERFNLTIEEASLLCQDVDDPAPLSGRCPVILKTDMTHLANKGENRARILAGLYDAVCENVQVLIKPAVSPPRVVLVGGVSRSRRIRDRFRQFLAKNQMELVPSQDDDALFFEALGCAAIAAERRALVPRLAELLAPAVADKLEHVPALSGHLASVRRMAKVPLATVTGPDPDRALVLGFDIGSTGSKAVAVDADSRAVVWEGYINTNGNPVGAAQTLMRQFTDSPASQLALRAVGATGSGREIVGSLMTTVYGAETVFVLNEIAAHATGALHFDPRVDTIFEIGGQDAKYVRLAGGRIVDAAMNEACSAGTGSFIEEQGKKFAGIKDVVQLGQEAVAADGGVSLGQHCSVFMAEIIDEAVAAGVEQPAIIAGIYDSIIQNYLNRVKGSRSVGQVIFCQGMPFAADALAAAVVRQTGSQVIIPPNPGTIGALGIALLALRELPKTDHAPLAPARFLAARVERKDTFVCDATKGCGGAGNKCRIDRLTVGHGEPEGKKQRFTWGGGCSLWDKGTRKRKLPDLAPDPFRERAELIDEVVARVSAPRTPGARRIAITDEFVLKGLVPFFGTFLHQLGLEVEVHLGADQQVLKRGIERANIPFCAPMQLYHGLVSAMTDRKPDLVFLPMLRTIEKVGDEPHAKVCPIAQASPDMLQHDLGPDHGVRIVAPVIDIGGALDGPELLASCARLAAELGVRGDGWRAAFAAALAAQTTFEAQCLELGQRALDYCEAHAITPVVVLGRAYTIHNKVLNSNVPAILREQGAIAVPVDCYPIAADVPVFHDMYWGYGQRILRAAHQARRTPGHYALFCSNYACGPDSFTLHFFSYIMEGKPFAIIETDGHSGDAGTKTRIEAFLHCVHEDRSATPAEPARCNELKKIELDRPRLADVQRGQSTLLIPRMGPGAEALAACLRGTGLAAEALPLPDRDTVRIGRRHTSGKECFPTCVTLGSLLQRIEPARTTDAQFSYFLPRSSGPCRLGMYNWLHKIVIERLGWKERVQVWAPVDNNYFEGTSPGLAAAVITGLMANDLLLEALYDVRPVETRPGAAKAIVERYQRELIGLLERECAGDLSVPTTMLQVASGRFFGCRDLVRRAGVELAAVRGDKVLPTVLVVGEIFVRCDPFSNDEIVEKLEERGLRARFAAFNEWLEYTDWLAHEKGLRSGLGPNVASFVQRLIQEQMYRAIAEPLRWPARTSVHDSMAAASDYLRSDLHGEAVLTVGGAVHEWRTGVIDGVVSVGPMECMPNKISEAQFFHVAEQEGLAALTLSLNGDPVDPEVIDNFAFEVKARFQPRPGHGHAAPKTLLHRSHRVLAGLGFGRPRWFPTPPPAPARTGGRTTAPPPAAAAPAPTDGKRRSVHLPVIVDDPGQH